MKKLPSGYYAVLQKNEDGTLPKSINFKGVDYSVKAGENAFATVIEAYSAAAKKPRTVLEGLDYPKLCAPVVLFSAGKHVIDGLNFSKSACFFGQKAGVSPNVPGDDAFAAPALNPEWEDGVSELYGSYWKGKMTAVSAEAKSLIFDGFSSFDARFVDTRKEGEGLQIAFRNIVHRSHSGHTLYIVSDTAEVSLEMKNIRLCDFDEFDYGANFIRTNAKSATFENLCYNNTQQLFGLTGCTRSYNSCSAREGGSDFYFKGCFFGNLRGENGLATTCSAASPDGVRLNVEDCVFVDAALPDEPFVTPTLGNENCSLKLKNCRFKDTRSNRGPAVMIFGEGDNIGIENCSFSGFADMLAYAPAPITEAPDCIGGNIAAASAEKQDIHEVIEDADFAPLDKYYEGCTASYGDLHVHSNSGGTSDGKTPIEEYVAGMDREQLDFVALVDHRQMRGFFLPAWDDRRMIIGTEPGTRITDLRECRHNQSEIHYNMLFPHKYGLAMVLANFPEFEFRGDELTGSFKYPRFTVARFQELCKYVESIGGIVVHPHPKTMMASSDPLDYYECFGEHSFLETLYGTYESAASKRNYELWKQILAAGKHMYTSCGSDSHGAVTHSAPATFYTKEKNGLAFFNQMKSADFAAGAFGMKMMIDGHPMGSEIAAREGQILLLEIADFFAPAFKENTAYELRVYSDEGLCYAARFNGKCPQKLALKLKKRRFYRAEIYNVTQNYRMGIGNPIWLDKEE